MRGFILALAEWLDQIHQGDCLQVMRQLPNGCVDLVFTSPPYNIRNSSGGGRRAWPGYHGHSDDMPHDDYVAWQRECIKEMMRLIPEHGAIFYNHAERVQQGVMLSPQDIVQGFPVRQIIIWKRDGGQNHNPGYFVPTHEIIYMITKPRFRLCDNSAGTVWEIPQERDPWIEEIPCFPTALPRRAIRASAARVVLDPFIGSGTTAEAAVLEGRSYIGIEQSQRYCQTAKLRMTRVDAEIGTPSIPLEEWLPVVMGNLPSRGSTQIVFRYIWDAVANNGWEPTAIDQQEIADSLGIARRTVIRAVKQLQDDYGMIRIDRHSRHSAYEIRRPPKAVTTAENDTTRTGTTGPPKAKESVTTAANDTTRTGTTGAPTPKESVTTAANDTTRTGTTGPPTPKESVTTAASELTPGPGPGPLQVKDFNDKNRIYDPGPGPGDLDCPLHAGHKLMWHRDDRIGLCCELSCSWVASRNLGVITQVGEPPKRMQELYCLYNEKWDRQHQLLCGHPDGAMQTSAA